MRNIDLRSSIREIRHQGHCTRPETEFVLFIYLFFACQYFEQGVILCRRIFFARNNEQQKTRRQITTTPSSK